MVAGFSLTDLLLTILIVVPFAVVLTGLISGTAYVFYLMLKDAFSGLHHMHHRGAH